MAFIMMAKITIGKRTFAAVRSALAGSLLLLAAACASGPAEPTLEPEITAAPPPPAAEAPAPELALPEEEPKNRVALLLPTTGANGRVGQSLANAANMALADIKSDNIQLTVYNTASVGAAAAAQRAIADGNKLFLGPLLSDNVREVRSIAARANIPVIAFSNDATVAGDGVYILGFQPGQSVDRVVRYARGQGVERFAALVPQGAYGQRASDALLSAVRSAGGRVVALETYVPEKSRLPAAVRRLTDYEARVARASQGGVVRADGTVAQVQERLGPVSFQALLIADSGARASFFLPSLQQYGAGPGEVRYLGTELWNAEPRLGNARGLHGSWFAAVPDERFDQLASRYRARFGGAPSRLASLSYDAVLLINSLSEEWPIGTDFPEGELRDPDGFVGVDGIFRFGTSGVAQRGLEVQEVGPDGPRTVSRAPRSFERDRVSLLN